MFAPTIERFAQIARPHRRFGLVDLVLLLALVASAANITVSLWLILSPGEAVAGSDQYGFRDDEVEL